ncbi:DUF5060 domain-containing protein [Pedobacter duraquae]|uniref:Cellulase (Glycosyl hydrolase family 5) n=1 Tax=Pedobacter duraquae TaxID=425511 RepID=A0A4R6IAZ0_9SPHI|nr:DUF5060 domain-containing protein [Pedobacter duraquae]TDO19383.1 cellulase (glycosyl hydrolase family 5) [Pedobacter duraquae]
MKRSLILTLAFVLLSVIALNAETPITKATLINRSVKQFEKAEWNVSIKTIFTNAYLQEEVALDMLLSSPSGKKLVLPCYYEAGESGKTSQWKARFLPQEKGKYSYKFQLSKDGKVIYATKPAAFNAVASKFKGILNTKNDWTFQFDNGEAFRGIGENICWESRDNDDSKYFKALHENPKYNYEYLLPALAQHGGNYFRTWICSWNLPLDWKSGFNNRRYTNSSAYFNPSAISKMDRMVNLSDSLGLYIMLTMGPGSYDAKNGRYATSTAAFFTDAKAKAQYKNRLRFIVARWGYSSAIGAWEFFNEIDNVQFRDKNNPIPAEHIVQWHQEMADYLKAIDPYHHLITTSISHRDLKGLNSIGAIDFNQKHIYKNNHALPTTIVSYASQFKKPYVIGEYGYEYDWSKNFDEFAPEMDSDFKRGLWYGLFSPTPILPLSWWWEYFDNRGTDKYIVHVRTIQDLMMKAGKGSFETFAVKSTNPDVETFSVKCGNDIFVYLYNSKKEAAQTDILLPVQLQGYELVKYTCETGAFDKPVNLNGSLKISAAELNPNADVVYILKKR